MKHLSAGLSYLRYALILKLANMRCQVNCDFWSQSGFQKPTTKHNGSTRSLTLFVLQTGKYCNFNSVRECFNYLKFITLKCLIHTPAHVGAIDRSWLLQITFSSVHWCLHISGYSWYCSRLSLYLALGLYCKGSDYLYHNGLVSFTALSSTRNGRIFIQFEKYATPTIKEIYYMASIYLRAYFMGYWDHSWLSARGLSTPFPVLHWLVEPL